MITIYGEVPSSKNSRILNTKTRRSFPSKFTAQYIKNTGLQYSAGKHEFDRMKKGKEKPYSVEFKFYRKTKRAFDFSNIVQIVQDMMVKHKWIDDDNYKEMIPVFVPPEIDKENPRVEIKIKEQQ